MTEVKLKKTKIGKQGPQQYYFNVPKKLIDANVLSRDKSYTLIIIEE